MHKGEEVRQEKKMIEEECPGIKGVKFLECRILLPDRPKNLNFAPSFGYATIFLGAWQNVDMQLYP